MVVETLVVAEAIMIETAVEAPVVETEEDTSYLTFKFKEPFVLRVAFLILV